MQGSKIKRHTRLDGGGRAKEEEAKTDKSWLEAQDRERIQTETLICGGGSLSSTTETQHQVEVGLALDVVVGEGTAVLEALPAEDESLLVGRDALLLLDLGLHPIDGVRGLHAQGDGTTREGLDEDLRRRGKFAEVGAGGVISMCCVDLADIVRCYTLYYHVRYAIIGPGVARPRRGLAQVDLPGERIFLPPPASGILAEERAWRRMVGRTVLTHLHVDDERLVCDESRAVTL
jgi:hypothetical protein